MKKVQFMSNDKKKDKKKLFTILSSLLVILALASTYAWLSYTDWVKNHMQSLGFDSGKVTIVEDFGGDDTPVTPGGTIKKKVDVINTTPVNSFVRVSLEEELSKLKTDGVSDSKGYATADVAGFPTVVDAKSYYEAGSTWSDETDSLYLDGTKVSGIDPDLKLFVSGSGSSIQSVLIKVIDLNKSDFPTNFVFKDTKFPIPTLPSASDLSGENYVKDQKANLVKLADGTSVKAAQKVTGHVTRNTALNRYEITKLDASDKASEINLAYWGYGSTVGELKDADWAGKQFAVTSAADVSNKPIIDQANGTIKSKLGDGTDGPTIKFTTGNLLVGSGKTFEFKKEMENKWFYNEDDGYFYFLSALASGAQTSNSVIDAIQFPTNPTYNLAAYDLHVGSEAVPAQRAMLSAKSTEGAVEKGDYNTTGKQTISNASGFGENFKNSTNLYNFLADRATIEDDAK